MSETTPATAELSAPPFVMVKIITGHTRTLEALAATSVDSLDHATLRTSYENAINLTRTLHCSKKLTN
jgi:hypothetical protein